jgi:hypothetical protein
VLKKDAKVVSFYRVLKPISFKGSRIEGGQYIQMEAGEADNIGKDYLVKETPNSPEQVGPKDESVLTGEYEDEDEDELDDEESDEDEDEIQEPKKEDNPVETGKVK